MSITQNEPRLLADIGGTNARFALETSPGNIENIVIYPCKNYATVVDAIKTYLSSNGNPKIKKAALAVANPVLGDWLQMTNHHWSFSIETTRRALGLDVLLCINDFTAQAYAISNLSFDGLEQVGGTFCDIKSPKAILGPGTGLGVSGLVKAPDGSSIVLVSEGGHVSFAPFDDTEVAIWNYARQKYGHVSAERFLSGSGLVLIYEALSEREGRADVRITPQEITQKALDQSSYLCMETLDVFCAMLGGVAGNLALTLGARAGVYICGGIVPRFIDYFKKSPFRMRFEHKGRFDSYLSAIPVYVVSAQNPGIAGVSVALEFYLRSLNAPKSNEVRM